MFKFDTRTLVATALGAALFTVLFMYVKIPSPIANTEIHTAYGILGFFAVLFGPLSGALIAFIGHALSDTLLWGSAWWSWVIASAVVGLVFGLAKRHIDVESGKFGKKEIITFNIYQVVGNLIAWLVVAPILDIIIYAEPANLVFTQGAMAALSGIVGTGIIGTFLLLAYAKTRTKEGSLE